MLGKLLDRRYQVTQVLGAGGFGRTYLAQDTRRPGNPACVVKQLKPANHDAAFLETARRLFYSEAEALEQLGSHDQIPRLLAYFEEDQEFYLVQEFVEGQTLGQELLSGQRWDESQVIQLLEAVLRILEFVHHHNVIHRDIKPDNLIRRHADKKLVLVDFGSVKQIRTQFAGTQGLESNTVAVGTPGYMASEQALGHPRPSSDVYALGIIAIQALTGVPPANFQEDLSTGEILWQHLVPVSSGLATVITKMTRYHFKDRYQSASEALQALQQFKTAAAAPPPPRRSSASAVSMPRQAPPQPAPSPSGYKTLPVAPAHPPKPPAPPQPRPVPPSTSSSSDKLPLLIGLSMAVAVAAASGMAYAMRQDWGAVIFGEGNGIRLVGNSRNSCQVTNGPLRVRSQPNANVLGTVDVGTKLTLTGERQGGWVEIRSPQQGWVFQEHTDCQPEDRLPTETAANPSPVTTPTPQTSPSPAADNGANTLAEAAEKYQEGNIEEAIADAKSVPADSSAFEEARAKIQQWQQEWREAKTKFDQIKEAFDDGRYIDVLRLASDSDFPEQRYWKDKLNELIEQARRRSNETEQPESTPSESPQQSSETPQEATYYVLADYSDSSLETARQLVPDAYVREFPEQGTRIQLGAFSEKQKAKQLVEQLRQQGISAGIYQF